jgi:hypothetical protein
MGQMNVQQTMMPQSFNLGGGMPQQTVVQSAGPTYVYGPNGELVPKEE